MDAIKRIRNGVYMKVTEILKQDKPTISFAVTFILLIYYLSFQKERAFILVKIGRASCRERV